MSAAGHRTGVVALLGAPNAGKSTLLNRLLGEKLAIVTDRPQTTRSRLLGILSREDAQVLFHDTPGLHGGRKPLNTALNELAEEAARDCDVALVLVDPTEARGEVHRRLLADLRERGAPVVLAATKADLPVARAAPWPPEAAEGAAAVLRISAKTGEGLSELVEALVRLLPEAPPLYPEDELSDRPLRFLAAELVREAAFEELHQEIPYSLAVEVEEFREDGPDPVRIRAHLLVERASQKRIVVGRGGEVIKRIGTRARREIEALLGRRVFLDLWVKVEPAWAKRPRRREALGYR